MIKLSILRSFKEIKNQIKQGVSIEKCSATIATGFVIGIFPILGLSTIICLVLGMVLKLNMALLQLINYCLYPLQLFLIMLFIRFGEKITGGNRLVLSINELQTFFSENPQHFFHKFWDVLVHAFIGWFVFLPFGYIIIYFLSIRLLRHWIENDN